MPFRGFALCHIVTQMVHRVIMWCTRTTGSNYPDFLLSSPTLDLAATGNSDNQRKSVTEVGMDKGCWRKISNTESVSYTEYVQLLKWSYSVGNIGAVFALSSSPVCVYMKQCLGNFPLLNSEYTQKKPLCPAWPIQAVFAHEFLGYELPKGLVKVEHCF